MSPQNVADAASGSAPISSGRHDVEVHGFITGNIGLYKSGEYTFRSSFHYIGSGLSLVRLKLTSYDKDCATLNASLIVKYGTPHNTLVLGSLRVIEWRVQPDVDLVSFSSDPGSPFDCVLAYRATNDMNTSGL